jgi:hypothetical protein
VLLVVTALDLVHDALFSRGAVVEVVEDGVRGDAIEGVYWWWGLALVVRWADVLRGKGGWYAGEGRVSAVADV